MSDCQTYQVAQGPALAKDTVWDDVQASSPASAASQWALLNVPNALSLEVGGEIHVVTRDAGEHRLNYEAIKTETGIEVRRPDWKQGAQPSG